MKRSVYGNKLRATCHRRRGALFHYYMVYMTLVSALLVSAGVCLHGILQADQVDLIESQYLSNLLSVQRTLRADLQDATAADLRNDLFEITTSERTIRWRVAGAIIARQAKFDGEVDSFEQFSFARGTRLAWESIDGVVSLVVAKPARIASERRSAAAKNAEAEVDPETAESSAGEAAEPDEAAEPGNLQSNPDIQADRVRILLWSKQTTDQESSAVAPEPAAQPDDLDLPDDETPAESGSSPGDSDDS